MLALLADEDFNNRIVRGLMRRQPNLDIVRIQNTALFGAPDAVILEWAAHNGRVLMTHDVSTMNDYANARFRCGESVAGIIVAP